MTGELQTGTDGTLSATAPTEPPTGEERPILTIAIPTYNRPEQLQRIVKQLLEQRSRLWKLVVIDNCSDVPSASLLPNDVHVIRNRTNVGIVGNVNRCFELCDTPYIGVFGDDDYVTPTAIEDILAVIADYPDAAVINFSMTRLQSSRTAPISCHGIDEFLEKCDNFEHLLWLSGLVFSKVHYWPYLRMIYTFGYSTAGQMVLTLATLVGGNTCILHPKIVTGTNEAERGEVGWSVSDIRTCVTTLLDIPMPKQSRRALSRLLRRDFIKFQSDLLFLSFAMDSRHARDAYYLYMVRWTHMVLAERSMLLALKVLCAAVLLRSSWFRRSFRGLTKLLKERITGRPFVEPKSAERLERV